MKSRERKSKPSKSRERRIENYEDVLKRLNGLQNPNKTKNKTIARSVSMIKTTGFGKEISIFDHGQKSGKSISRKSSSTIRNGQLYAKKAI